MAARRDIVGRLGQRAEAMLDRTGPRLVLSAAIILSLLPAVEGRGLELAFLAVFGLEFVVRLLAVWGLWQHDDTRAGVQRRTWATWLLVLDFVALLSFVPMALDTEAARPLRLFRLSRMLLLFGYWAPMAADLWTVLSRRERARQLALMALTVWGMAFSAAVVLHHFERVVLDADGDGAIGAGDRSFTTLLWWAFRQVEDPGNLVETPAVPLVVLTSMGLTLAGLFLVSFLIGIGTDVMRELVEVSSLRAPGLRDHSVLVNVTPSTQRLLAELMEHHLHREDGLGQRLWRRVRMVAKGRSPRPRYVVVGPSEDPPPFLRGPDFRPVVYRERTQDEQALLDRIDARHAKRIVLLAEDDMAQPDAETIHRLLALADRFEDLDVRREPPKLLIAEVFDETNTQAAEDAVGDCPGLRLSLVSTQRLIALHLAAVLRRPGLEVMLDELLTSTGCEIYTCIFGRRGMAFSEGKALEMPAGFQAGHRHMLARGLQAPRGRVLPLGVLCDGETAVRLDAADTDGPEAASIRGVVAVAPTFRAARDYVAGLPNVLAQEPAADAPFDAPVLPARAIRNVVFCGFRRASLYLLAALLAGEDAAQVLIVVADEGDRRRTLSELAAHGVWVEKGIVPGEHGHFEANAEGEARFVPAGGQQPSRVQVEVADVREEHVLLDLPAGYGSIETADTVIFSAGSRGDSDGDVSTTLLKMAGLCRSGARPHVLAELHDPILAARLQTRCRACGLGVHAMSIDDLRAYFLFQALAVPEFDKVYSELLGSWGASFVRVGKPQGAEGRGSFEDAALRAQARGLTLVSVILRVGSEEQVHVAPDPEEPGGTFSWAQVEGFWAVAREPG